ncbi:hypothetical protein ACH4D4_04870 [Streptomyces pristinaespiralis]|uniref:hypothetical protein n=1 Tax=Streptomyces pristinaespiralis TaxID=38300 RepID=UPI0037988FE9
MTRTALRLVTDADLDAYEAEQAARRELTARHAWALHSGDELELRRVEALIAGHDIAHGTQILASHAA